MEKSQEGLLTTTLVRTDLNGFEVSGLSRERILWHDVKVSRDFDFKQSPLVMSQIGTKKIDTRSASEGGGVGGRSKRSRGSRENGHYLA